MPGIQSYVDRRLPTHMQRANQREARYPGMSDQWMRKKSHSRHGKPQRMAWDPASQFDWIYGGKKRPAKFAGVQKDWQNAMELGRAGYSFDKNMPADPMQNIFTIGEIPGIRAYPSKQTISRNPGDYGTPATNTRVQDNTRRGPSGKTAGFGDTEDLIGEMRTGGGGYGRGVADRLLEGGGDRGYGGDMVYDVMQAVRPDASQSLGPGGTDRHRTSSRRKEPPTIGAEITPEMQNLLNATTQARLQAMGAYRSIANLGYGPGAMERILSRTEGPENRLLEDLPGRIDDQINLNTIRGADARRDTLRGLETGPRQRPGAANRMVAEAMIPMRMDEARFASDIIGSGYDTADRISLSQGERQANLLHQNEDRKLMGLAGLSGEAGATGAYLSSRPWDTEDPMNKHLSIESFLTNQRYENQLGFGSQQQKFGMYNDRMQSYLRQVEMKYGAEVALALESQMQSMGLGRYADQDGFMDYLTFGLDILKMIPGPHQVPAAGASEVTRRV